MKKTIKCLSALLMSSMLAVSASTMALPAMADVTYTITMSSTASHTYSAYQIFKGTLHEATSGGTTTKTLSDIVWGDNISSAALLTELDTDTNFGADFTTSTTASEAAAKIKSYNETQMKALAKIIAKHVTTTTKTGTTDSDITGLSAGYYLIKDTTEAANIPAGGTYSEYMLEVVSNVSITAKDTTVSSEKKVTDTNDSTGISAERQDSADYDVGDTIPYVLTFTLPSNYADYATYPVTFTDDMCAGLTYNSDAKIYYGASDTTGTEITFTEAGEPKYTGGKKYTYTTANLKTAQPSLTAGSVITIIYTATLNSSAVIGNSGNPNTYSVTYMSDPNASGSGVPTAKTPDDTNVVFTYKFIVNKIDENNAALTGADFTLYKFIKDISGTDTYNGNNGTWTVVSTKTGTSAGSTFEFSRIDDGVYKLSETTTPPGYNKIADKIFTIEATHTETGITNLAATGELTIDGNETAGTLTIDIQNTQGVTLPSTGGIGTTIFYVVGGSLIALALIMFIVKKRMSIKEK